MKFEVVDREEVREGLIRKKSYFHRKAKLDFDDAEMAALTEMCKNPRYAGEEVGEVHAVVGIKNPFTYTLGGIAKSAAKEGGIYTFGIRMETAEAREVTVDEFRDVAKTIKKRFEIFQHVNAVGSQDTVEEI